ncbi:hypothetical protein QJQ45_001396 [Haematococcus lacustris]|nr:hypothetical protein QJQ45_001396 [Haematococcus lacustris]
MWSDPPPLINNKTHGLDFCLLPTCSPLLSRAVYDQTGETDEDLLGSNSFSELRDYFRAMFKAPTEQDLDAFYVRHGQLPLHSPSARQLDSYRGSPEERAELLKLYVEHEGKMTKVFDWTLCSEPDLDSHRFKDIIQAAIATEEVPVFKAFTAWAKKVAKLPVPADPLRKRTGGLSTSALVAAAAGTGSTALAAVRKKRAEAADAFFDQLAEKYGGKQKSDKGKKRKKGQAPEPAEPTDEEFEAIQARMLGRRSAAPASRTDPSTSDHDQEAQEEGGEETAARPPKKTAGRQQSGKKSKQAGKKAAGRKADEEEEEKEGMESEGEGDDVNAAVKSAKVAKGKAAHGSGTGGAVAHDDLSRPAKKAKGAAAKDTAAAPVPVQTAKAGKRGKNGNGAKAKPAPQPGRWVDRDCNAALNMQRIGESKWRPLELCYWPDQGALPAKGKEYPGLGYKRVRDKPPKAQQQQQQPAMAQ